MKALCSTDRQAALAHDHRGRAPRAVTLLITGKLILDRREGLCRVRNISATGMMIETHMALEVGQEVRVGMRWGSEVGARVAWTGDGAVGLAFPAPIDVEAALAAQSRPSRIALSRPPREPRLVVDCAIEVEARGEAHHAVLLDISQPGAKLRLPFRAMRDERLLLSIPGLPLKGAAVHRVEGDDAGVGFYEALPFGVLAAWVEARG